mmetsp:Transcript_23598/g.33897  ORF Transcript_23598/g.33897 Transcript_23598/m.33897 type:complete len:209 (+) Transcript_23598:1999-2625(+)
MPSRSSTDMFVSDIREGTIGDSITSFSTFSPVPLPIFALNSSATVRSFFFSTLRARRFAVISSTVETELSTFWPRPCENILYRMHIESTTSSMIFAVITDKARLTTLSSAAFDSSGSDDRGCSSMWTMSCKSVLEMTSITDENSEADDERFTTSGNSDCTEDSRRFKNPSTTPGSWGSQSIAANTEARSPGAVMNAPIDSKYSSFRTA